MLFFSKLIEELATEGNGRNLGLLPSTGSDTSLEGKQTGSDAKQRSPAEPESTESKELITDAQRRYLFRLLAERRIEGEDARRYLLDHSHTSSLDEITKAQASDMIEELLKTDMRPQEVPF